MDVKPEQEHQWLQQLVGSWEFVAEAHMGPDQPPMKSAGRETVRMLGELWSIGEGEGEMPDGNTGYTMMTLGYNPGTKRFVGSWVGSMMAHLWIYDGFLDDDRRILTLESDGPDFSNEGNLIKYRDVIEIIDENTRTLRSSSIDAEGNWTEFMKATYTRK